jgi:hypothetical protein
MARRIRQPLGRQYAYPARAAALSQKRVTCGSVFEPSVLARHDGPDSLELRLSSLEYKVDRLTSLVESKLGRLTGEAEVAARIASAPVADAPAAMSAAPLAREAVRPTEPAVVMLHPSQPVMPAQPVVWVNPGATLLPAFYMSAAGWAAPAPAGMVMHPGVLPMTVQHGVGAWPAVAHRSGELRPRRAGTTTRPKRSARGAPMPMPPWEYNTLRAAGELPGPGHYSPHLTPENSSFNIRITPNPEHPGYGAYTARSLPPRPGARAKAG